MVDTKIAKRLWRTSDHRRVVCVSGVMNPSREALQLSPTTVALPSNLGNHQAENYTPQQHRHPGNEPVPFGTENRSFNHPRRGLKVSTKLGQVLTPDAQISSFVCRERPIVADFCLSRCNIVVQCSELVQKVANGKNRPFSVSRDLITERPLRSKSRHSAPAI